MLIICWQLLTHQVDHGFSKSVHAGSNAAEIVRALQRACNPALSCVWFFSREYMVIVPTPPVYYFLTTFPTHPTYLNIRDICAMYRLPHPLVLLSGDLSKHAFKSMAKLHIRKYWKERLTDEVRNLKSLQFFEPRTCSVWRPHLMWEFSKSNPFESCKAMVVAPMISGRYRTDMLQKQSVSFTFFGKNLKRTLRFVHRMIGQ